MATRRRFLWPALAGVSLVILALALAGAQPAQAIDPVGSAFRLGTGVPSPNDPGNNVTALTSSAGTTLDVENNLRREYPARRVCDLCCRVRDGWPLDRGLRQDEVEWARIGRRERRAEPRPTGARVGRCLRLERQHDRRGAGCLRAA